MRFVTWLSNSSAVIPLGAGSLSREGWTPQPERGTCCSDYSWESTANRNALFLCSVSFDHAGELPNPAHVGSRAEKDIAIGATGRAGRDEATVLRTEKRAPEQRRIVAHLNTVRVSKHIVMRIRPNERLHLIAQPDLPAGEPAKDRIGVIAVCSPSRILGGLSWVG
jgi:hypothetical protein